MDKVIIKMGDTDHEFEASRSMARSVLHLMLQTGCKYTEINKVEPLPFVPTEKEMLDWEE